MAHVLVVDDDEDIRETLTYLLEEAGHSVLLAADGDCALEALHRSDESMVVLLDLQMPRINGMEVMEAVSHQRALSSRHAYVIVTANGRTLPLHFIRLMQQFNVPMIIKPFDIETLLNAVDTANARIERARDAS